MKSNGNLQSGTGLWESPNLAATNESGFTGLPGGYRTNNAGTFNDAGTYGFWWSSSEPTSIYGFTRGLIYNDGNVSSYFFSKAFGFPVRCVRD